MTKIPRLHIPAHTSVSSIGPRVTLDFFTEDEADEFMRFIEYMGSSEAHGKSLVISQDKEVKQ